MAKKGPTRRQLLTGTAALAGAATAGFSAPAIAKGLREWRMTMTWPKMLPGLGAGAMRLAERITQLSDGKLTVKAFGAGEIVPAFEMFDAVSSGTVEMGHGASYYWLSKSRACAFFCAVPGGMTAQEINAWIYYDEGLKLWHELYAPFNLVSFPAGNTGTQMGGWFNRELRDLNDLKGMKMRIPGLAGEVFGKLGGVPENIPGGELFSSLQAGRIDALEWVGPWNDMALGFHRIASHYYGPGFHEGGPCLELMINRKAYLGLPKDLQRIVKVACATENQLMQSEYYANNLKAFRLLQKEPGVSIATYPEDILRAFFSTSEEVVASVANDSAIARRIYESYAGFRKTSLAMQPVMEQGFLRGRTLAGG